MNISIIHKYQTIASYFLGIIMALIFLFPIASFANLDPITFNEQSEIISLNYGLSVYEDKSAKLSANEVLKIDSFLLTEQKVPNLGISPSSFWLKFEVKNNSNVDNLILTIAYPILDLIEFYEVYEGKAQQKSINGDQFPFDKRKYKHQNFLIDLNIDKGFSKTYLLKVQSWELITLPLTIGTSKVMFEFNLTQDLVFGLFLGIMLVLIFYNLFIYFTVRDLSYLYYVIYITFITLTQATLYGYTFRVLFSDSPSFSNISLILFNSIAGIATIEFLKLFLKTKSHTPILHKGLYALAFLYSLGIVTSLLGFKSVSYQLMDLGGVLIALYTLFIAIKISIKGYRPAKIFLVAWTIFLLGVIFFVLKGVGILPSNIYTNYTMTFGIAIEGTLLSIALADRINILRREKEDSQQKTLAVLKENQDIIKNQNAVLEQKVDERTVELNETLTNLKEAQSQLVDAEKMSSLGQLTAGIAHEINNPINFVSSNIAPLRQDLADINEIISKYEEIENSKDISKTIEEIDALKKELDFDYLKTELTTIIDGIEDGARRTQQIVSGLRNFSRLDEGDLKAVDINEGIEATIVLIKGKLNGIIIKKSLGEIPKIECNPGKINQMVMNLIDNTIYAIDKKKINNVEGIIEIKTEHDSDCIQLTVKDNGIGIPEEAKSKLFDPFFTTKDVGEGTGLGLSIVRNIIDNHGGKITVNSTLNLGTEIIVKLPLKKEIYE